METIINFGIEHSQTIEMGLAVVGVVFITGFLAWAINDMKKVDN